MNAAHSQIDFMEKDRLFVSTIIGKGHILCKTALAHFHFERNIQSRNLFDIFHQQ